MLELYGVARIRSPVTSTLFELQGFLSFEYTRIGLIVVNVSRRRVNGVTTLRVIIAHFALQHADIEITRATVEIVEARTAPEHVKIPGSAVERVP